MNKRFLKVLSLPAISLLLLSCTSNNTPEKDILPDSVLWSISAGEKVVRNRSRESYSSLVKETSININACRGEYEYDQIVITPTHDVDAYNASVSALKNSEGFSIPSKNIELLGAKYVDLTTIYDTATGEEPGRYPDALVPIKALRNYNDTAIKANENQSIYLSVEIPLNQKPGLYTGTLTITLDNTVKTVPVSINVYDYQVNEETHSRSIFETGWMFESGELDATENTVRLYAKTLQKYRLSGHTINFQSQHTPEDIQIYTDRAYELMASPKCTNVSIPIKDMPVNNYGEMSFNEDIMKQYITNFFLKSLEKNFNMFKKTAVYMGSIIDEPDDRVLTEPNILWRTRYVCERYNIVVNEIADSLDLYQPNHPLHKELIGSIRNIPNVVTSAYNEYFDGYVETYCPKANFYNTPEQRELYKNQREKWWYTCVFPKAPFPTYHTEDRLSSARLLSWMQSNYDVTGNLFWATNVFASQSGGIYYPIDDYYEGPADRYAGVNGDGYLFYPAAQYGLEEPAGCLRLFAIRDGLEEYEILYNLKESLSELDLSNEGLFSFLTQFLYEGTVVNGGSIEVENARDDLIKIAMANENGSDFNIVDYKYDRLNNKVDISFYAKESTSLKVNDVELTDKTPYKEGHIYKTTMNLEGLKNMMNIEVSYNGKTNVISHTFGEANIVYEAEDYKSAFKKYNASVTATVTNYEQYENILKLDVGSVKGKKQSIKFIPSFLKDINDDIYTMTLNIINPTEEDILFSVGNRFKAKKYDQYFLENITLKPGMNQVEINLSYTKFKNVGGLDYIMFVLGDTLSEEEAAKTIYFSNIVLTRKQGGK